MVKREFFTAQRGGAQVLKPVPRSVWLELFRKGAADIRDGKACVLASRTEALERWQFCRVID